MSKATVTITAALIKEVIRNLPCRLTDAELLVRADELSQSVQEITAEENRQVDVKAQMKARLTELDSRKTRLAITVGRKEEYRDVVCDCMGDYQAGTVTVYRRDTGEALDTRLMSEEERQKSLPLEVA